MSTPSHTHSPGVKQSGPGPGTSGCSASSHHHTHQTLTATSSLGATNTEPIASARLHQSISNDSVAKEVSDASKRNSDGQWYKRISVDCLYFRIISLPIAQVLFYFSLYLCFVTCLLIHCLYLCRYRCCFFLSSSSQIISSQLLRSSSSSVYLLTVYSIISRSLTCPLSVTIAPPPLLLLHLISQRYIYLLSSALCLFNEQLQVAWLLFHFISFSLFILPLLLIILLIYFFFHLSYMLSLFPWFLHVSLSQVTYAPFLATKDLIFSRENRNIDWPLQMTGIQVNRMRQNKREEIISRVDYCMSCSSTRGQREEQIFWSFSFLFLFPWPRVWAIVFLFLPA